MSSAYKCGGGGRGREGGGGEGEEGAGRTRGRREEGEEEEGGGRKRRRITHQVSDCSCYICFRQLENACGPVLRSDSTAG